MRRAAGGMGAGGGRGTVGAGGGGGGGGWRPWLQLCRALVAMVAVSIVQDGWALFVGPLQRQLPAGTSLPALQLAFSIFVTGQTAAVPFAGALVDRHGPRPVLLAAAPLFAGGWATAVTAASLPMAYLGFAISALGVGAVYASAIAMAVQVCPAARAQRTRAR